MGARPVSRGVRVVGGPTRVRPGPPEYHRLQVGPGRRPPTAGTTRDAPRVGSHPSLHQPTDFLGEFPDIPRERPACIRLNFVFP